MTRRIRMVSVGACAFALGMLALRDTRLEAQSGADVQRAVDSAYEKFETLHDGKNADYIPALAKVDPNLFGIAVVTADGKVYTAGDVKTEVSIQSISKVFTMAQVIQEQGSSPSRSVSESTRPAPASTRSLRSRVFGRSSALAHRR